MNIGLLGCGVVGGGIMDFCTERTDLHVTKVLVRRERPELGERAVTDIGAITGDDDIGIVIEVMGGLHPAYEYICQALRSGKHVVTANKAVISAFYPELARLAAENGVALRCTAAVGGGIPWLTNLERCKRLDAICEIGGIMNGTTNFIMDAMHAAPVSFPAILKQAQELGYAEADPSADIDGDDVRRKLTISANVAFDALIREEDIPMFGIRTVTDGDIRTAACAPILSRRWWTATSWRPPCRRILTLSPTAAKRSAATASSARGRGVTPPLSTPWRTVWTFWRARAASTRMSCSPPPCAMATRRTPTMCAPPAPTNFCGASPWSAGPRASLPPASAWKRCSGGAESS